LSGGKVSLSEIKALSASQANAAYGHLNYSDLGRNPTIQHLLQWGLVAPDFLEADRKSTRLNSSHLVISYAVFCLKKKKKNKPLFNSKDNKKKIYNVINVFYV